VDKPFGPAASLIQSQGYRTDLATKLEWRNVIADCAAAIAAYLQGISRLLHQ